MADGKIDPYANDAERSRERLSSTFEDLQDRLSPRRVLGDAAEAVQDRGAALARAAGDHKLALGLIGGAVGLLLLARRGASALDSAPPREGEEPGALRRGLDSVRAAGASVTETAAETWQTARDRTADLATSAKIKANEATQFANENFNTNPLLGAVLGLAAGALAGSLLPRTEAEDTLVGEHRDRFTDAAKGAIKAAVDAGREQLDGYGLNADTAREKFGSLTDHARDFARNVGQAAADNFRNGRVS